MVRKIISLFYRELGGIHKAALVLGISSMLSALFGILRDRLLAGNFGAGRDLDIYYAAFKIPDFVYVISLSIISINILIPFFLERLAISEEQAKKFLNEIFSFFLLITSILAAATYFLIPLLSDFVAPGFSAESKRELILLSRILIFSPIFLGFSNLISSVIQSYNLFAIYALSPVVYNIGIIFGLVFLYPRFGIKGIVFGVVLGAIAHMAVQIPALIKLKFFPTVVFKLNFFKIWRMVRLSFPRTLGLGLNQIVLIFITAIASFFGAGSIAAFNLSFNLQSVPVVIIGLSYGVAAFPVLAKHFTNNRKKDFLDQSVSAIRQIIFWSIPISAAIIVLRAQIVRIIFGSGKFDWQDTRLTAAALAIFACSIVAQSLIVLLVRAFYASGKTWKPIVINLISSAIIVAFSLLAVKFSDRLSGGFSFFNVILRLKDNDNTGLLSLPLAYSLGTTVNAVWLFIVFQKEFGKVWSKIERTFFDSLKSSAIMGGVCYLSLNWLDNFLDLNTFVGISVQGFLSGAAGLAVLLFVLRKLKNRELEEVTKAAKQKFWKVPIVASEPENLGK